MSSQAPVSAAHNVGALKLVEKPPRGVYLAPQGPPARTGPQQLARGACYNCNYDCNLIIFPTLIEGEGQLALCSRCIKRAAKLLELGNVQTLQVLIHDLQDDLAKARETITDQATVIASYEALHQAREKVGLPMSGSEPLPGTEPEEVKT